MLIDQHSRVSGGLIDVDRQGYGLHPNLACIFHQGEQHNDSYRFNSWFYRTFERFPDLQFVLSGFALHLASHFGKSFSNHSYRYDFSNDLPNFFASYSANSGSLVNYAG